MLLYVFGNSGVYYCLLSANINLLIFCLLVTTAVHSELLYFKHMQQGWSCQEKKKTIFWLCLCSAKKGKKKILKKKSFPFCWG